jgi:CHAT domain-containing protein
MLARLRDLRPEAPKLHRLLAVGNPVFRKSDDRAVAVALRRGPTYAPLPGTQREVEAIAALFPVADKLLGADAGKPKLAELERDLGRYDVLHLATHGVVDPDRALQSALILSQSAEDDGQLTALHMKEQWQLRAEMVVLSACETGLGRRAVGEGYLGFSQALFLAGARSVLLSLWEVDDTATALLMVRFYENLLGKREGLKSPLSKAEALREAKGWLRQLTALEIGTAVERLPKVRGAERAKPPATTMARPFEHPHYWSAFILVGDPD